MSSTTLAACMGVVGGLALGWVPRPDLTPEQLADAEFRTAAHIAEIVVNGKHIIPGARLDDGGILVVPDGVADLAVVVYPADGVRTVPLIDITVTQRDARDINRDGVVDIFDLVEFHR